MHAHPQKFRNFYRGSPQGGSPGFADKVEVHIEGQEELFHILLWASSGTEDGKRENQ